MLNFEKVALEGFRSFREKAVVRLDRPGLNYLQGDNGAGKSSVFEAVYWCLFGRTSRGVRASNVASWNASTCRVALYFTLNADAHKLVRTWKPNSLRLNGDEVDQATLEKRLGYTPDTFIFTVYHAQFTPYFCDLQPARQLDVFSQLLRLNLWEAASDAAGKMASEATTASTVAEHDYRRESERALELSKQLDELSSKESEFYRTRSETIGGLKQQRAKVQRELDAFKPAKKPSKDALTAQRKAIDALIDKREALSTALARLSVEHDNVMDAKEALSKDECPLCGQKLPHDITHEYAASLKRIKKEQERDREELEQTKQEITAATKALVALEDDYTKAYMRYETRNVERDFLATSVANLDAQVEREQTRSCPYDTRVLQSERQEVTAKMDGHAKALRDAADIVARANYWKTAFKHVRLALVDEYLVQFEVQANDTLAALGLEDWHIGFDVERDTKSGTVRRGFSIDIESPYNAEPVPFEVWSGGETQRLRLAITFAFSQLIQDVTGQRVNLEVFDEPTSFLTDEGIDDLLTVLHEQAKQRALWLVDHRTLEHGGFDSVVLVEKTKRGSKVSGKPNGEKDD